MIPKKSRVSQLCTNAKVITTKGSPLSADDRPISKGKPSKKQRTDTPLADKPDGKEPSSPECFVFPPCNLYRGLFIEKNPLLLHEEEERHILGQDRETRGESSSEVLKP